MQISISPRMSGAVFPECTLRQGRAGLIQPAPYPEAGGCTRERSGDERSTLRGITCSAQQVGEMPGGSFQFRHIVAREPAEHAVRDSKRQRLTQTIRFKILSSPCCVAVSNAGAEYTAESCFCQASKVRARISPNAHLNPLQLAAS